MDPVDRSDGWGVCHELAVVVHRVTVEWPPAEMYGLAAQARRAAFAAAIHLVDDPSAADPPARRRHLRARWADCAFSSTFCLSPMSLDISPQKLGRRLADCAIARRC